MQRRLGQFDGFTGHAGEASRTSYILRELRRKPAQAFQRHEIGPDVVLFRGEGPPASKSLIIAMCGRSQRPNMAWSLFLQYLPAQLFDVVILCDRRGAHYTRGITGYADDLLQLQRRLMADIGAASYRRVYCYGTSSGGLPAIRMGLLAGVHRSIAVGPVFAWPIHRLIEGETFQTFDPICACNRSPHGAVLCIHASNERDTLGARHVELILSAQRVRIAATTDHNVNHHLYLAGRLMEFHGRMFEFDGSAVAL